MVWLTEKRVFYHFLDLGFECVKIPVRVKFEFEVKGGALVPDSITKSLLYNKQSLESRYPHLDQASLQRSIERKVESEVQKYLQSCGFTQEESE